MGIWFLSKVPGLVQHRPRLPDCARIGFDEPVDAAGADGKQLRLDGFQQGAVFPLVVRQPQQDGSLELLRAHLIGGKPNALEHDEQFS